MANARMRNADQINETREKMMTQIYKHLKENNVERAEYKEFRMESNRTADIIEQVASFVLRVTAVQNPGGKSETNYQKFGQQNQSNNAGTPPWKTFYEKYLVGLEEKLAGKDAREQWRILSKVKQALSQLPTDNKGLDSFIRAIGEAAANPKNLWESSKVVHSLIQPYIHPRQRNRMASASAAATSTSRNVVRTAATAVAPTSTANLNRSAIQKQQNPGGRKPFPHSIGMATATSNIPSYNRAAMITVILHSFLAQELNMMKKKYPNQQYEIEPIATTGGFKLTLKNTPHHPVIVAQIPPDYNTNRMAQLNFSLEKGAHPGINKIIQVIFNGVLRLLPSNVPRRITTISERLDEVLQKCLAPRRQS
eukprot:jgi/Bigna1/74495/fgenesh1_pg.29_\